MAGATIAVAESVEPARSATASVCFGESFIVFLVLFSLLARLVFELQYADQTSPFATLFLQTGFSRSHTGPWAQSGLGLWSDAVEKQS